MFCTIAAHNMCKIAHPGDRIIAPSQRQNDLVELARIKGRCDELTLPLRLCWKAFRCPLKPLVSGILSPNTGVQQSRTDFSLRALASGEEEASTALNRLQELRIRNRPIGQWLSERLGQQFVVENRPGAGSNLATEAVVNAAPDGYTPVVPLSSPARAGKERTMAWQVPASGWRRG
jgi:hypothetical protein